MQFRKTILILGGIALVCVLLIARILFTNQSEMTDERHWFVKGLRYEFSAQVDSVWMFNANSGRLWCRLTAGNPQINREDSLKRLFKEHDMLYLIFHRSADSIIFIMPDHAGSIARGDSLHISSKHNSIQVFRDGTPVISDSLSNVLTGYARPFFMKKK